MKGYLSRTNLLLVSLLAVFVLFCRANENHQYCIVGAGPSGERWPDTTFTYASLLGLQLGYFLHKAERDYVIIEKESIAGSYYSFCIVLTM